jgi:hypothetical protein
MMLETRISKRSDFSDVDVFEQIGPNGKAHRLAFVNHEFVDSFIPGWGLFGKVVVGVGVMTAIFIVLPAAFYLAALWIIDHEISSWFLLAPLFGAVAVGLYLLKFVRDPRDVQREIVLDYGADRLRLTADGRPAGSIQLSAMTSLTIEPHPMVELERLKRVERKQTRPSQAEKTHCLFAYYGPGGANKARLVSRAEWPNHDSLREVRAAIIWAINQAGKANQVGKDAPKTEDGGTIRPPLD